MHVMSIFVMYLCVHMYTFIYMYIIFQLRTKIENYFPRLLQYMSKASKFSQTLIYDQKIHICKNVVQILWC